MTIEQLLKVQIEWQAGLPPAYRGPAAVRKNVSPAYFEVVQDRCAFAETPTSKFLDLVACHIQTLIELDGKNPRLLALLKRVEWTGTQPSVPFDEASRRILGDWMQEIRIEPAVVHHR